MAERGKKINHTFFVSKYSSNIDNLSNQKFGFKRTEKRHRTESGRIPNNFQAFINKNFVPPEKEINKNKFQEKSVNLKEALNKTKTRKYNSTLNFPIIPECTLKFSQDIEDEIKINSSNNIKHIDSDDNLAFDKSKSQPIPPDTSNLVIHRRLPNFPKYERRISDEFYSKNIKSETSEIKGEIKKVQEKQSENKEEQKNSSRRRRSIGAGIRNLRRKESLVNKDFCQITYVKSSKVYSKPGINDYGFKKTNQDTYINEKNINNILNFNIFAVLDGHGDFGHLASNFIKRYIFNKIRNHPAIKKLNNPIDIYKVLTDNKYQIITNIFLEADEQIKKEKFNCEMSGTTCVLVIQLEDHIICANTGDSRAILVYEDDSSNNLKSTKVFPLSRDAKPENPKEKERIIARGGVVAQMIEEGGTGAGPYRVWIKGEEYPGLAMSRSLGDMDAKTVGVIPNPEFIEYKINSSTRYILVCSDGIWEFINNEEAMNISNKFYSSNDALGLCHQLINISTERWLKEDIVIDDITVVAVFF